ncbi:transposase [Plantactinospora sp. KLBMP9567]|uniref:transposase n=1 Tax=Plantactinospora sp. KLBMP9567 TaxID=3085900 RepID=UPI0029823186|nr:transposase [Plantactinospora sp. KLBMP9567]MDW5326923.1 transposase [Plantactinospora sp. KLBMP9567]
MASARSVVPLHYNEYPDNPQDRRGGRRQRRPRRHTTQRLRQVVADDHQTRLRLLSERHDDLDRRLHTNQTQIRQVPGARRTPPSSTSAASDTSSLPRSSATSGEITRFSTADHLASYAGTSPLEAASGERRRHRLGPTGNRQLNPPYTPSRSSKPAIQASAASTTSANSTKGNARRALKRRLTPAPSTQPGRAAVVDPAKQVAAGRARWHLDTPVTLRRGRPRCGSLVDMPS